VTDLPDVRVRVDEAGKQAPSGEIDDVGARPAEIQNVRVAPNRGDSVPGVRQRRRL